MIEAERRAHGKVERFAGVTPYPYPCKGTVEDMGQSQRQLYESVLGTYNTSGEILMAGDEHYWLLGADGVVRKLEERSSKAASARFINELSSANSLAVLSVAIVLKDSLAFSSAYAGWISHRATICTGQSTLVRFPCISTL